MNPANESKKRNQNKTIKWEVLKEKEQQKNQTRSGNCCMLHVYHNIKKEF